MSLISKIEEEFGLLRAFLVSTLGDHFHIHSGVQDALEAVTVAVKEAVPSAAEVTPAEPVASEEASGGTAEPSAPASEEDPSAAEQK